MSAYSWSSGALSIAALVKQVPRVDAMVMGEDGRLIREGQPNEMNAYCRRAVTKAIELARATGGSTVAISLGPAIAEDCIREAVAGGIDRGVLLSDPEFAGSDTLLTARTLAAGLQHEGPFDLILVGRNSVDADTGQVGPQLAELLGLPFAAGALEIGMRGRWLAVRSERDDGYEDRLVRLPAILSVAERLCEPTKRPPADRQAVPAQAISILSAADLGPGPWGQTASPTSVGEIRKVVPKRVGLRLTDPSADSLVHSLRALWRGTNPRPVESAPSALASLRPCTGHPVAALIEPKRLTLGRELLGVAARLAARTSGFAVAVSLDAEATAEWSKFGADHVVQVKGALVEEDVANAVQTWAEAARPSVLIAPGTLWGREVASRVAAHMQAGLVGDAVDVEMDDDGRLVAWKPALGGSLVAAIRTKSFLQAVTLRPGVFPVPEPRSESAIEVESEAVHSRLRWTVEGSTRNDDIEELATARVVLGLGAGVQPEDYSELEGLRSLLGAELAATRKVTDRGWLPRARQVGLTGRSIRPDLYLALGISGSENHLVGIKGAQTVISVNNDQNAAILSSSDLGIVGDWRVVVPLLVSSFQSMNETPRFASENWLREKASQ